MYLYINYSATIYREKKGGSSPINLWKKIRMKKISRYEYFFKVTHSPWSLWIDRMGFFNTVDKIENFEINICMLMSIIKHLFIFFIKNCVIKWWFFLLKILYLWYLLILLFFFNFDNLFYVENHRLHRCDALGKYFS